MRTAILRPESLTELSAGALDLTLRVARRAGLLGRLAERLRPSGASLALPSIAADQLSSAAVMLEARQRICLWELDRVEWALRHDADRKIVLLKGCAYVLAGLPNSVGRVFTDVDLLFPEQTLPLVEKRLEAFGWQGTKLGPYDQNYYRIWSHELPPMVHVEREVEVDLHHNILPRTSRLHPDAALLLEEAVPVPGTRFHRLGDTDLVLHAIVHLMFDSDMADRMRDLVDIDELLRHFAGSADDFWARLHARAMQLGLLRPAYYGLRYAQRLLDCPVPPELAARFDDGAPSAAVRRIMDFAVPRALYPQHPDLPSTLSAFARALLYVRSHWIRMPLHILVRHTAHKLLAHGSRAREPEAPR